MKLLQQEFTKEMYDHVLDVAIKTSQRTSVVKRLQEKISAQCKAIARSSEVDQRTTMRIRRMGQSKYRQTLEELVSDFEPTLVRPPGEDPLKNLQHEGLTMDEINYAIEHHLPNSLLPDLMLTDQ